MTAESVARQAIAALRYAGQDTTADRLARQLEPTTPQECCHEWADRGSGPDDRWRECWLCGAQEGA